MTAKYAKLLAERFDFEPSPTPLSKALWGFVYPAIIRHILRGETSLVVEMEVPDYVMEVLVKQGYRISVAPNIGGPHLTQMTTISWSNP